MLSGVSAGIIGLNKEGHIQLHNQSAEEFLELNIDALIGTSIESAVPAMADLFRACLISPHRNVQGEVRHVGEKRQKTLLVSFAAERQDKEIRGFVITFDDVTELLQLKESRMGDVARRIAHEIKIH